MTAEKGNMWCGHEDMMAGMTAWAEEWGRSRDLDIGEVGNEGSEGGRRGGSRGMTEGVVQPGLTWD